MADKKTMPVSEHIDGNVLFDRAAFAIGLNGMVTRKMLSDVLRLILSSPHDVTIDELGAALSEIESRIRLMVPPDDSVDAIARLRKLVLTWEEL